VRADVLPDGSRLQTRPGYVLFAVLVVVVVLSLVAYQYQDAMASEYTAAARAQEAAQARANAIAGIHYAAGHAADPNSAGQDLTSNDSLFAAQPVGSAADVRGGNRFSLFHFVTTAEGAVERRAGLGDESAKLNINALIALDPVGNTLHDALMKLPNMTEDIADAIVDWVDADSTPRPAGLEDYTGQANPIKCKNGPINSLEELLLVRGVTPDLLFGTDRNRNGVQDGDESSLGTFTLGWSQYLTCYGREVNVDGTGTQRVNLNGTDAKTLSEQLTAVVGQDLSDYILYYRFSGTGEAVGTGLGPNKVTVEFGQAGLRDLVQAQIDKGAQLSRRLTSTLTVVATQIRLPAVQAQPGQPTPPQRVVACPVNSADALKTVLPALLDKCTASDDYEMTPRVNVYTAPREVLACLPGLADTDVEAIVSNRPTDTTDPSAAWLVTAANLDPAKFKNIEKYVCGRSGAYRVQSVGYFAQTGGPVARAEAVIEVVQNMPRIVYFRDLTDLGRGFDDLPR
jgi:type II secretory pathway component PulK